MLEANDGRDGTRTRAFTIGLLVLQVASWFAFVYLLFYYVPAYKILHRDFNVMPSSNWDRLVAFSDWLVINTYSDMLFRAIFLAFLVTLIAANIYLGYPNFSRKPWLLWSVAAFFVPFTLLGFALATIGSSVHNIISIHPEVLEYQIWWINVFQ